MVIIMRGVSGGGKSTFAKRLASGRPPSNGEQLHLLLREASEIDVRAIFSADDFFIEKGVYCFDRSRIGEAHADCLYRFVEFVRPDEDGVCEKLAIVDNTNTTVGELAPYAAVAKAYGHEVHVVEVHLGNDAAVVGQKRNVHGVPLATTERQLRNIDQSRKFIKERYGTFHTLMTGDKTQ